MTTGRAAGIGNDAFMSLIHVLTVACEHDDVEHGACDTRRGGDDGRWGGGAGSSSSSSSSRSRNSGDGIDQRSQRSQQAQQAQQAQRIASNYLVYMFHDRKLLSPLVTLWVALLGGQHQLWWRHHPPERVAR